MRGSIALALLVVGLAMAALGTTGTEGVTAEAAEPPLPSAQDVASQATDSTREAALAPVRALFDAMRARDTVALVAAFHPRARLSTTAVRDGERTVVESTVDDFVRSVGGAQAELDERLGPATVQVDGDLATAWTPYAFFVDGEFSHCGVNAFQLVRGTDGAWTILQVTDTLRRRDCPPGAPR